MVKIEQMCLSFSNILTISKKRKSIATVKWGRTIFYLTLLNFNTVGVSVKSDYKCVCNECCNLLQVMYLALLFGEVFVPWSNP